MKPHVPRKNRWVHGWWIVATLPKCSAELNNPQGRTEHPRILTEVALHVHVVWGVYCRKRVKTCGTKSPMNVKRAWKPPSFNLETFCEGGARKLCEKNDLIFGSRDRK